jgi:hypothetical protein
MPILREGCFLLLATNHPRIHECLADIRAKARELREAFGDEGRACSLEWAARKVEQALRDESDQLLTLAEASAISGYHPDSLARMVRDGQIPDLRPSNSKGMIRIRRADLPIKPGRAHTPRADVRELASRLAKRGKEGRYGHL